MQKLIWSHQAENSTCSNKLTDTIIENAQLVNPKSVAELTKAMIAVIEGDNEVKLLAEKAIEHAHSYTWKNVAKDIVEIVETLE